MRRTIKLEGRAQRLAQEIAELVNDSNARVEALHTQASDIQLAAQERVASISMDLKAELGLEPDACCHLDTTYMAEHGVVYAHTGCEAANPLAELLGARARKAGGLH